MANNASVETYARVLVRRWWLIVACAVLVPAVLLTVDGVRGDKYEASAKVLVDQHNLPTVLSGLPDIGASQPTDEFMATQASLARVPTVAQAAVKSSGSDWSSGELLAHSSVTAAENATLLDFRVSAADPELARLLVDNYANAFIAANAQLSVARFANAEAKVRQQMNDLATRVKTTDPLYQDLARQARQLAVLGSADTSQATLVQGGLAAKVSPRPSRDLFAGLSLGILLGIVAAFASVSVGRTRTTVDDLARVLGVRVLAEVPPHPTKATRRLRGHGPSVDFAEVSESYRRIRAALDRRGEIQWVLVTGVASSEQTAASAANLAGIFARSGSSVALIDLDLRNASTGELLGLGRPAGLTDLATGNLSPSEIGLPIRMYEQQGAALPATLWFVPAGTVVASASDAIRVPAIQALLQGLRERFDLVVAVAPHLARFADAASCSVGADLALIALEPEVLAEESIGRIEIAAAGIDCPIGGLVVVGQMSRARGAMELDAATPFPDTAASPAGSPAGRGEES